MSDFDDDYELARALAEHPERAAAIIRSAYRWGYRTGWEAGYDRSFDAAPKGWKADTPSHAELCRRRGEVPDGNGGYRTLPRAGDRPPRENRNGAAA